MAFGPATNDIEQTLLTLLQGRQPSPLAPVATAPTGGIGPLEMDTTAALAALQPQPVPPALPGPVDAEGIRSRFAGLAGPEPMAPTVEPTSLIVRIARALQGFGAGVQGQGPQFIEGLRQQTEAPQREFRARKERFDTRKQELELAGEQAILTAEEKRAARTTELLDKQNEREREEVIKRAGFKSAQAIAQIRGAFDLELQARKAEAEQKEQDRKDAKDRASAVTTLANTFTDDFKIPRDLARRFADFEINQTPLSQADAKKYGRIEKYRPSAGGTGGAGGSGKVMIEIQNQDGSLSVVPFTAQISSGVNSGQITQGPRGVFVEGQPAAPAQAKPAPISTGFPEFGAGLAQPIPGVAPSPTPISNVITRAQIEANAKKTGRDPRQIEADIRARGGTVQ